MGCQISEGHCELFRISFLELPLNQIDYTGPRGLQVASDVCSRDPLNLIQNRAKYLRAGSLVRSPTALETLLRSKFLQILDQMRSGLIDDVGFARSFRFLRVFLPSLGHSSQRVR